MDILIKDISKVYPTSLSCRKKPPVFAVNHVSFAINKGECFGLLGPNGAGKTALYLPFPSLIPFPLAHSLPPFIPSPSPPPPLPFNSISILTGLYAPTSGTAFIHGLDISKDLETIRRQIGICPQFDVQWDSLTPLDHVLFYTRLKGVPLQQEREHAVFLFPFPFLILRRLTLYFLPSPPLSPSPLFQMNLLNHVGLQECADKKSAKELSGGMRRRLSVAMSLAGNPKIVFLDEPTSGLDPLHKRQLWDIVSISTPGRSIILTTHSMEEADVLCGRIGIIAKGK